MTTNTRFKKGQSGNPKGKPPGARNKTTLAMEALLDGEAEAITRKAIEKAKEGDMAAIRLCLERHLVPVVKSRPIKLKLPPVATAEDIMNAQGVVIATMARGEITPDDASVIAGVLEARRRVIETVELEKRIEMIEQRGNG
jgi:hypothetical protein